MRGRQNPKTPSRLVLIMSGSHIVFAGLIAFLQDGLNAIQTSVTIFLVWNRARLKLHFCAVRQIYRFQRSEHTFFIHRMDRFHALLLPYLWQRGQFLYERSKARLIVSKSSPKPVRNDLAETR
jgi:hypothetical protein